MAITALVPGARPGKSYGSIAAKTEAAPDVPDQIWSATNRSLTWTAQDRDRRWDATNRDLTWTATDT